ncbi:MAG TPA: DUF58 domain-containing protein [Phycisphaerae bacterium]|nr:DUF58 domain-containing protein [Phycisphaerae bacterium]HRR85525.1 DUF58 domain-containing protein [Phycisphaerae bacterium]
MPTKPDTAEKTRELLKKVRRIQVRADKLVNDVIVGEYRSVFKGRGMEFDEVREYIPGDDIRSIDWNVTARTGWAHVKRYVEEREMTVILLVDVSLSGRFGSSELLKIDLATEISAVLAFSAIKSNDKIGLLIFTDRVEKFIPAKKGKRHVLRVIRELLSFEPQAGGTDVAGALEFLNKVLKRKAVVFLVSDFIDEDFERDLALTRTRHDLIPVRISDPRETSLPDVGLIELEDAETGERVVVDTRRSRIRDLFSEAGRQEQRSLTGLLRSMGADSLEISTDRPYMKDVMAFFRRRERRMKH